MLSKERTFSLSSPLIILAVFGLASLSFFSGYLFAKVNYLEKGTTLTNAPAQANGQLK